MSSDTPIHASARPERHLSWKSWWVVLFLAVAIFGCYANSLKGGFIYDDFIDIFANSSVRRLWPLSQLFFVKMGDHWYVLSRPIPNLTFALNHAIGGFEPFGYHLFNVGVHVAATLALFGIIRRTLSESLGLVSAGLLALWWGIHPLQTESVAYVTQRYESIMGLFVLLTVLAFVVSTRARRPRAWQSLALFTLLLALYSKEVAVGTPLVIFLYDRAFVSGSFREAFRRHRFFYLGALILWGAFLFLQLQATPRGSFAGYGLGTRWWEYAQSQPGVILHYLRLGLVPHPLVFDYMWPAPAGAMDWVPQTLVLAGLLGATGWALVRHPKVGFLASAIWIYLAPTSSVLPILDRAVEHRMYLSLAPLLVLTGWGLSWICDRAGAFEQPGKRKMVLILGALGVSALAVATMVRNMDYRSQLSIWNDTVQKVPTNPRAWLNLGVSLDRAGRILEAEAALRTAIKCRPDLPSPLAAHNLGNLLLRQNNPESLHFLEMAATQSPHEPVFTVSYVMGLLRVGQVEKAVGILRETASSRMLREGDCRRIAGAFQRVSHPEEAEAMLRRALEFDPRASRTLWELAHHLIRVGKLQEGRAFLEQAIQNQRDPKEAALTAAWVLQLNHKDVEASERLEAILRKSASDPRAMARLAWLRATSPDASVRNGKEALRLASAVIAANPSRTADLLDTLAAAQAEVGQFAEAVATQERILSNPTLPEAAKASAAARLAAYRNRTPWRSQDRPMWFAFEPPPVE